MENTHLQTLPLQNLHERHFGITQPLADGYLEAVSVCLDRYHASPQQFDLSDDGNATKVKIEWQAANVRTRAAWNNDDDATRDGAYACAIAATELSRKLVAIRRAETRTGADYYVAPSGEPVEDLENVYRLEVSGTSAGDPSIVKSRVNAKVEQAKAGNSNLPAIAAVIGFRAKLIVIETVSDKP